MSLLKECFKIQIPGAKLRILTSALNFFLWGEKKCMCVFHKNGIMCYMPVYNLRFFLPNNGLLALLPYQ